jgi:Ca2+-binding RTX toxin-like protein
MVVMVDSCGSDVACGKYDAGHDVPVVVYLAAAGEANRVVASRTGDEVTVSDAGAAITARDDCRPVGPHAAVCTAPAAVEPVPAFSAQLGDGDDTLTITGALGVRTSLEGGAGDDALTGDDVISGRGGPDTLSGELGADRLDGGAGEDRLRGDPAQGDDYYTPRIHLSRDVLRGGAGDDTVTDSGGANRLDGGSGDDLLEGGSGPDRLVGGPGADWLSGHRGADRLSGGAGRDEMRGGAGADRLLGGAGVDRLFGGSGRDRLLARDRTADRVDCGRGRDRARADAKDRVRACER